MSTEERDKALAEASNEYMLNNGDSQTRNDFIAGALWMDAWDARGQVTPDREAIAQAINAAANKHYGLRGDNTADDVWLVEAILALFNEKGNE